VNSHLVTPLVVLVATGLPATSVVADVSVPSDARAGAPHAEPVAPEAQMDPTCPTELKANVLAALWKRHPSPQPPRGAPSVMIRYRNDYGQPADALLFALDGVAVKLKCNAERNSEGLIFNGPLKPGVHQLDAVFDFALGRGGRGGRSPLTFKVQAGTGQRVVVVIDRNGEEWPVAYVESTSK
jgi:hypothetical protein